VSEYDYGPLRTYEVTWKHGHVETVQGHQVLLDSDKIAALTMIPGSLPDTPPRFTIRGMFPGRHWRLVLMGLEADILSIRDVTDSEVLTEVPDA
jgi:hypothetical protein